jgi:hypothetical protein
MFLKFSGSKDILVRVHSTNSLHFFCKNCTTNFYIRASNREEAGTGGGVDGRVGLDRVG